MTRLALPEVTLLAVSSIALPQTIAALARSAAAIDYGAVKLLTSAMVTIPFAGEVVAIPSLDSRYAYSAFIFGSLHAYIATPFVQIVQWDGFVSDVSAWDPAFLTYDYIGAVWPQFGDGHDVGNGGFSFRSARLLAALRTLDLPPDVGEDVAICRLHRQKLEKMGMVFAPADVARRYSHEREAVSVATFGFHGAYNIPQVLGQAAFRDLVLTIDPRTIGHRERTDLLRHACQARDWRVMGHLLRQGTVDPALRAYWAKAAGQAGRQWLALPGRQR